MDSSGSYITNGVTSEHILDTNIQAFTSVVGEGISIFCTRSVYSGPMIVILIIVADSSAGLRSTRNAFT